MIGLLLLTLFDWAVVSVLSPKLIPGVLTLLLGGCKASACFGRNQLSLSAVGVSPLFPFLPLLLQQ